MKFKDFIKTVFRIHKNVIKGELEEIQNLTPTEEDYKQGEAMADVAVAAMASVGLGHTVLGKVIIAKVFAYGIRDIKDGVEDNSKLIIGRVIEEIRHEQQQQREQKTEEA